MSAPGRDVVVDAARAFAIAVVVCFHCALLHGVLRPDGGIDLVVLSPGPRGWAASWFVMVMPMFFALGGYAHSVALLRAHRDGTSSGEFLARRGRRLLVPLALMVAVSTLAATVLHAAGSTQLAQLVGTNLSRLLWFLAVYLCLVIMAPVCVSWQHRFGMRVVLVMAALSLALSMLAPTLSRLVGHLGLDPRMMQVLLVWPLCHQLGIAWQQGFLRRGVWRPLLALVVGVAFCVVGVLTGWFAPAAVGFGDSDGNITPPTLAMAALALAQLGLLSLLHDRLEPLVRRPRVGAVVTFLNLLAMTLYLWQVPAIGASLAICWGLARLGIGWALSPFVVIPLTWVVLVVVAPWIARLENRLTPSIGVVDEPLVLAGSLLAFVGTWTVWRRGLVVSLSHPMAAFGVVSVLVGTLMVVRACHSRSIATTVARDDAMDVPVG